MKFISSLFIVLFTSSLLMASSIEVKNQYVRATPPNIPNSAAFMKIINNTSKDISIIGAKSNIAKKVELHTHDMKNGMMRMYQVQKVDVKANSNVMFKPGSFHVMFLGLNQPLKESQNITFTLLLSNGEKVNVTAPVKKVMAGMKHGKM